LFGPWLSIALAGADASKVANTIIAAEIVTCRMVASLVIQGFMDEHVSSL
jgi:hypothetical protein